MKNRIHENPIIQDRVTFIKTSEETNGEYTLVEVELNPKGGNVVHYHKSFDEKFIAVEGKLGIEVNKKNILLEPGNSAVAVKGDMHRFYNPSDERIKFRVELRPGSPGFEKSVVIGYALARDGMTNKSSVPKKFSHIAVLFTMSDTNLPGFLKMIEPILKWKAKSARKKGLEEELVKKYCE